MKFLVALFALVAVASASHFYGSLGYRYGYGYGLAAPLTYSTPLAYSAPIAYHAPAVYAAPAIKSGYVAATRGSYHEAPLPEGPFAASHHFNTLAAPGTF